MKLSFMNREETKSLRRENYPSIADLGKNDLIYLEQIKAMRAKFEYKINSQHMKVVAVTSAIAGEGKTTSCGQLAIQLAMTRRKKILLIDTDIRKSDMARSFGISPLPGLSEYLSDMAAPKDILRNTFLPGLYIVPAGGKVPKPGDLLAGEKFKFFIEGIRNDYDVVLLDTPPILPVADTLNIRDHVDGFLFLYLTGMTPHPIMRQAIEELGAERIIGMVLNGVRQKSKRYYARYYGRYYQKTPGEEIKT